jgi:hypothetical protein
MNQSEIIANRAIGVLGLFREERSMRDMQLQHEYGTCNKTRETFDPNSGAAVTEIPAEYANGWEERSLKDKMMLVEYNPCKGNKEGYEQPCYDYSGIGDNPFNPLVNSANRVAVSNINRN